MKTHCILQAEDCEEDIFFLQFAFKEAAVPLPLQVVRDGQEVIDYISGTGKYADRSKFLFPIIVLLDLKMPRKTGWEVLEWIRRESPAKLLPVIVLSGSSRIVDVKRAYELGANAYLVKSDLNELTGMAQALKGFWLGYNQFPDELVRDEKGHPDLARKEL